MSSNAVIISGYVKNSGTGSEVLVAKYDLNGNLLWSTQYNSAFNESERSADMVVDATGNIYITGRTDIDPVSSSNNEILVQKYNTNGAIVWTNVVAGNISCTWHKDVYAKTVELGYFIGKTIGEKELQQLR